MLSMFRTLANTWVARILLGLLAIAFVGWGISGRGAAGHLSNAVIQAGSHTVSPDSFKLFFRNELANAQKQTGQQLTPQDAVAAGFDLRLLQGLAGEEAFAELTSRMGVRPAPSLVIDQLRKQPDFFNPITGQFDARSYEQTVGQMGMTTNQFESQLRDEIGRDQLATGLAAGLKAPNTLGAVIADFALEARTLSYFVVEPKDVEQPTPPTDAQLQTFMTQHAAELMRPELRTLSVVRFSPKALAESMPVDSAALQKAYDFKKDSLSTPEKRSLIEVPVHDAATAATVAKRINAGEAPEAVAKSFNVQPITYADAIKSAIADPKVAEAAFAMKSGQPSAPVQSDLSGYAVIKVTSITPSVVPTLDQERAQLEPQVKLDAAKTKAYAQMKAFDEAQSGGATFDAAAQKAGVAIATLGPLSAQGVDANRQPVAGLSQMLMKQGFSLSQGQMSDVEDEGGGEYFEVRVDKVTPPALPALADVKGQMLQAYIAEALKDRMQAKADQLTALVKKGQSIDAVAASAHLPVNHAVDITRQSMAQNRSLSGELLSKIFSAKQGEALNGRTAAMSIMVAHVDSIAAAAPGVAASMVLSQRTQLSEQLFQDMGDLARESAKKRIKPTYDQTLARQAIGVNDDQLPKSATPAHGAKAP